MSKYEKILVILIGFAIIALILFAVFGIDEQKVDNNFGVISGAVIQKDVWKNVDLFVATTTNATSSPISIIGAKSITLFFSASATSTDFGSREFHVQTSEVFNDDTAILQTGEVAQEFIRFNKLIRNLTNTNGQQLTRVGTITLSVNAGALGAPNAATTTLSMDLEHDSYLRLSCSAVEIASTSEDVSGTCRALIKY